MAKKMATYKRNATMSRDHAQSINTRASRFYKTDYENPKSGKQRVVDPMKGYSKAPTVGANAQSRPFKNTPTGKEVIKNVAKKAIKTVATKAMAGVGAFSAGYDIGQALNKYTPIQKYIAKGVDKLTGLDKVPSSRKRK